MYKLSFTKKFKKDLKRCEKRGFPIPEMLKVLNLLEQTGTVPASYRPHKLTGNYEGYWECHIKADWLLVWQEIEGELILLMTDTGSHADLF